MAWASARARPRWCTRARPAARILDGDPDEDPTGDAGRPICGECERSRNFDADLQLMDEEDRR